VLVVHEENQNAESRARLSAILARRRLAIWTAAELRVTSLDTPVPSRRRWKYYYSSNGEKVFFRREELARV